jgi:hypothetical protein
VLHGKHFSTLCEDCNAFTFTVKWPKKKKLEPEDKCTTLLQNVWKYSPNNTVAHPKKLESEKILTITKLAKLFFLAC